MNNAIKFGLVALGGYLLWSKFGGEFAGILPTTTPIADVVPGAPGTVSAVGTPNQNIVPTTPTSMPNTRTLMLATAGPGPYNFDEWNWFYTATRNAAGPNWEDAVLDGKPRDYRYTVDEYLALISAKGFSGIPTSGIRASSFERAYKRFM